MKTIKYEYTTNGGYADTVGILEDGRKLYINTQYDSVTTKHTDACDKTTSGEWRTGDDLCSVGTRINQAKCTCGALDGIVIEEVLEDARINGKFGTAPKVQEKLNVAREASYQKHLEIEKHGFGWCNKCGSYCYGDCEANAD